jgi:hypothetical protein
MEYVTCWGYGTAEELAFVEFLGSPTGLYERPHSASWSKSVESGSRIVSAISYSTRNTELLKSRVSFEHREIGHYIVRGRYAVNDEVEGSHMRFIPIGCLR